MKDIKVYNYTIMLYHAMTVLLKYTDCSLQFSKMFDIVILHFPIMLTLCLMLSMTYYAQNYAGIIGGSLIITQTNKMYFMHNNQSTAWAADNIALVHMSFLPTVA